MKKFVTAVALLALGAGGLFDGMALVTDPTGASLDLGVDMLPPWHTWDYRYAGAFVLVALGMLPLVCAAAVIVDVARARLFAGVVGMTAIGWSLWLYVILDVWAPRAFLWLIAIGCILLLGAFDARRRRG